MITSPVPLADSGKNLAYAVADRTERIILGNNPDYSESFASFFAKTNPVISPLTGRPSQEIGCTVRYSMAHSVCTLIDNESRKDPSMRIKAFRDVTP